jgi:predicted DNA-binding protein (UPF0251 family)
VDIVYKPARVPMNHLETIDLAHDELEALKLCDQEGLTQEQAGVKMEVSRGTVQRLLTVARRKVATALVNRHALVIKN